MRKDRSLLTRVRPARLATGTWQRVGTTTVGRLVSRLLRNQWQLLGHRFLGRPRPEERWAVVVRLTLTGIPHLYFRFDYERVWVWTKHVTNAELFHKKEHAERIMRECCLTQRFDCEVLRVY